MCMRSFMCRLRNSNKTKAVIAGICSTHTSWQQSLRCLLCIWLRCPRLFSSQGPRDGLSCSWVAVPIWLWTSYCDTVERLRVSWLSNEKTDEKWGQKWINWERVNHSCNTFSSVTCSTSSTFVKGGYLSRSVSTLFHRYLRLSGIRKRVITKAVEKWGW